MPKFNDIIQTFQNGEISPKFYGRTDSDSYKRSCRSLKNMIAHPQGGVSRRMGSMVMADKAPAGFSISLTNFMENLSENGRIIEFVSSQDEVYLIMFNGITTQGETERGPTIQIYNVAEEYMFTVTMEQPPVLYMDKISDGAAARPSSNDLDDATILQELTYTQKGDVMFIFHRDIPPIQIARYSKNIFYYAHWYLRPNPPVSGIYVGRGYSSTELMDSIRAWPMTPIYNLTTTITASATTGNNITLTASADFFTADMVGTPMAVQNSGTIGFVIIKSYTSATVVNAHVFQTLPGTSAYTTWYEAAWSKRRGWPSAGTFWELL